MSNAIRRERFFIDTDIILRFLTRDNPQQAQLARHLLQRVEARQIIATTSEGVIVDRPGALL